MASRTLFRIAVAVAFLVCLAAAAQQGRYWEGRPDFVPGDARGYFIWNDDNGWHVRWTTKGERHLFAGTITCDGIFMDVRAISQTGDFIKKTANNTILFDTEAAGDMDGVDFRLSPSTTTVTFDLKMDGRAATLDRVRIGKAKHLPDRMPFRIVRTAR